MSRARRLGTEQGTSAIKLLEMNNEEFPCVGIYLHDGKEVKG
jgi:hypothetical protein